MYELRRYACHNSLILRPGKPFYQLSVLDSQRNGATSTSLMAAVGLHKHTRAVCDDVETQKPKVAEPVCFGTGCCQPLHIVSEPGLLDRTR